MDRVASVIRGKLHPTVQKNFSLPFVGFSTGHKSHDSFVGITALCKSMKTALEIPDPLCKSSKICEMELGTSLKAVLVQGLENELSAPSHTAANDTQASYWANRQMLPEFKAAWESGVLSGGARPTGIISQDRDAR